MGQCSQQVKIPGTQPPAFRLCQHPAKDGADDCAKHGGPTIRPRRRLTLWGRMVKAWRGLVG